MEKRLPVLVFCLIAAASAGEADVFLNAGGPDVADEGGRVWVEDTGFLVSGEGETIGVEEPIDRSLLGDSRPPPEVLATSRNGEEMRYVFRAEPGTYRVTLYFSENCPRCVGPALGGTGCADCARIMNLVVENFHVEDFVIADAALPPGGDGRGRIFTAVERSFTVTVTDGELDIRISSGGEETATVNAIAIEEFNPFRRGDANGDGVTDIADAVSILGYLFGAPDDPSRAASNLREDPFHAAGHVRSTGTERKRRSKSPLKSPRIAKREARGRS